MKNVLAQRRRVTSAMSVLFCLCVLALTALPALGGEYYVNKQGNDANEGQGKAQAFLTIQKGVDALSPGDTLTIGPGEYFENVIRPDFGSMDADTVIRAEISGTVLLRGDVPIPEFKRVEGYRFVYAVPFDQKPYGVLEHDTLLMIHERANVSELEFDPGFFHYDAEAKMLYVSRADLLSPQGRYYTVAVNGNNGLYLEEPKRVVLEGLGFTGFFPEWGVCLLTPHSCVVRDCVFFMNVGGVVLAPLDDETPGADSGANNLIENCVCYGNSFGGVVRYYANNDTVRNCYMYRNAREGSEHFGVMHYHGMPGPFLIENNISWGHNFDFSVKPGPQKETLKNCVGLDHIRIAPESMDHCLFHGANEYGRRGTASDDNVLYSGEKDLNWDTEFADSENLDFRLQPDSRFRGAASDGSDRGPYQYEANIFYASPDGDDEADGLSSRTPWKTLARALKDLRPGDTLYLSGGEYEGVTWNAGIGSDTPTRIRGRGRAPVKITGPMSLDNAGGIEFERLAFADTITLNGIGHVTFNNCIFSGEAGALSVLNAKGLRLTHNVFVNAPITLQDCSDVFLSGNMYANSGKPAVQVDADEAILYSDYNNYADPSTCWQIGGSKMALADVQKQHDLHSLVIEPQFVQEEGRLVREDGGLALKNATQFVGRGPNGTTPGIYLEYPPSGKSLAVKGPFLHSVSDTTANIEWWSTSSATYSLAWGQTPEVTGGRRDYRGQERFNTFSLTDLKPDTKYYFKIVSPISHNQGDSKDTILTFTTAAAPAAPKTYYVAPDGNDGNSGLSRDLAFKTVSRAAARVGPGDTVMLAEGGYNERVRVRAAGTKERPITFRSIPGEQGTLRGDYLSRTFDVIWKPDIRFDGIYVRGRDFFSQGFVVRDSARVQFTRCLNVSIIASNCPGLLVRNCTVQGYWNALSVSNCPNSLVENNVFTGTILRQINGSPTVARNNIFCECIRGKCHQTLLDISNVKESNNCFYLRWPVEEKLAVNNMPLPVYCLKTGSNSFAANPMLPGIPGQLQGWQLGNDEDFNKYFSTNPKLIVRGIGLQPDAFVEFGMGGEDWPYTRAWAEKMIEAMAAAEALVDTGKHSKALAGYKKLLATMPMARRLKSDVLEKASICAELSGKYKRAMKLAKDIPIEPLAIKRQMQIMTARKQYAELLDAFAIDKLGGRKFTNAFAYPELEDVMADLYYYRGMAYAETGDLEAAEADLRAFNDKRVPIGYTSGEKFHDLASLRLGNFYRDYLKDDAKALEAYLEVCDRIIATVSWAPAKADLTGASQTLVEATEAACEILAKQGKTGEVEKLKEGLKQAQEKAAAALQN